MPPVTPAHAPIADRVVIASQRGAIDTVGHIASAAASITSDSIDRYLHSRRSHPLGRPSSHASSSTSGTSSNDAYRAVGLPLPRDIHGISGQQRHMDVALYFLEDMLRIVRYISDTQGIPVHAVTDVVRQHQSPDMVPQT